MKMKILLMKVFKQATPFFALLSFVTSAELSVCRVFAATKANPHEFHIEKEWNLGGEGGWGLPVLDSGAHRLYIPRNNRVMIVDSETGALLGEVTGMKNVRAMVLDDSGRHGYVTDPTDGTAGFVRIFDRFSLQLIASVPTGLIPAAIAFEPATKQVFAFNSHSHSATIIDASTNQVTATVPLSGRPAAAVVDGNGNVYVTLPALGEIVRIDASQKKVTVSWKLGSCTGPAGLAIDGAQHQLFTTCENHKLVAINTDNGNVTTIGDAPPISGEMDFDPRHNMLFLTDASGSLVVLRRESPVKYSVIQRVATQPGARAMAIRHEDDTAYLVTAKFGMNTATASEELQFRPTPIPGTFSVIVVGR